MVGRHFKVIAAAGLASLALSAAPALAADEQPLPKVFSDVLDCRQIADAEQRLACFDRAVLALESAQQSKSVVVVSEEEVRKTRRGLFGFALPRIGLFGGGDDDDQEEVNEISSAITSFSGGTGRWVVTLDDGAVWEQTDGAFVKKPQVGQTILIRRAAFGSFMGRIDNGVAFRIKRRN